MKVTKTYARQQALELGTDAWPDQCRRETNPQVPPHCIGTLNLQLLCIKAAASMLAITILVVLCTAAFHPISCCYCCVTAVPGNLANHNNQTENLLDTNDRIVGPDSFVAGSRTRPVPESNGLMGFWPRVRDHVHMSPNSKYLRSIC